MKMHTAIHGGCGLVSASSARATLSASSIAAAIMFSASLPLLWFQGLEPLFCKPLRLFLVSLASFKAALASAAVVASIAAWTKSSISLEVAILRLCLAGCRGPWVITMPLWWTARNLLHRLHLSRAWSFMKALLTSTATAGMSAKGMEPLSQRGVFHQSVLGLNYDNKKKTVFALFVCKNNSLCKKN